jgi:hypothetical protein
MKFASWFNVLFGAWLIVAPWIVGYRHSAAATEDVIFGIAVLIVGLWSSLSASENVVPGWINLILGLWVIIAPWVIGYSHLAGRATTNDVATGILIAAFAAIRIATSRRLAPVGAPPPPRY